MTDSDTGAVASLLLYDTLTASKRPLKLASAGECGVYCCGPTTYDMAHIGHARAAIAPDLLVRYLRSTGLKVKYVRNVTDIDDKIIARAAEAGETPEELSQRFTRAYREDMAALGNLAPDVEPLVTTHIAEIIAMVETLIAKGLAYPVDGDVYYRVQRFEGYGQLSKRKLDDMQAGARVDVDERKENPMDFALWKGAKPGEPSWESPWGPGRPGWHIECSAMSCKHLGESFDVHTGGRDLIFPHHENEIAQSQGALGPGSFAQHWMHNGFVNFAGEKMSKSLGNFFTVREVLDLYHPEVVRYAMLSVHYRSGINFDVEVPCPSCGALMPQAEQDAGTCSACGAQTSPELLRQRLRFPLLEEVDERVAYVYETITLASELLADVPDDGAGSVEPVVEGMLAAFLGALKDDLNTAAALAELSDALSLVNRLIASGKGTDRARRFGTLRRFVADMKQVAACLGCFERVPSEYLLERRALKLRRTGIQAQAVEALIAARAEARAAKDWARADEIRVQLDAMQVKLRDGAGGTTWSI